MSALAREKGVSAYALSATGSTAGPRCIGSMPRLSTDWHLRRDLPARVSRGRRRGRAGSSDRGSHRPGLEASGRRHTRREGSRSFWLARSSSPAGRSGFQRADAATAGMTRQISPGNHCRSRACAGLRNLNGASDEVVNGLVGIAARLAPCRCFRRRRRTDRRHRTRAPTRPRRAAFRASPAPLPFADLFA